MRKQTKIAAIVSAAALLVIGASMTSFAATGWQEENGTWVYYNKAGEKVTEEWAKSGDKWFYLGSEGEMVTNSIIEDNGNIFYVDENGVMVTNRWVEIDNSADEDDAAPDTVWYYFQNNGKAYTAPTSNNTSFKTINGKKYAFDEDGKMLFGWVGEQSNRLTDDSGWVDAIYYLGNSDDGSQFANTWAYIHVIDDQEEDEDQDYWFYFGANGKKYKKEHADRIYEKTINGKKYTFDMRGKMLSEWVATPNNASWTDADSASASNFKYFSTPEDGARYTRSWFRVLPSKRFDSKDSEDEEANARWFYADGKGGLIVSKVKTINGKKYAFDENGEMLAGLRYVEFNAAGEIVATEAIDSLDLIKKYTEDYAAAWTDTSGKSGVYYFGDEEKDGAMKTGLVNLTVDGDSYTFKFRASGANKGQGEHGRSDKSYYMNGRKVQADSDDKYKAYLLDPATNHRTILMELDSTSLVKNVFKYKNDDPSKEIEYKGDKNSLEGYGAADKIVVLNTSGSVATGTKKDGYDVKLVIKGGYLVGAYIEY